jgi:FkbM family methyltransferase
MSNTYSQNKEDLFILQYFGNFTGRMVEIGANNGVDLSNSRLLIEHGWSAHLLEPGTIFTQLQSLYENHPRVKCHNIGIGERDEVVNFYESGAHVPHGKDYGLVSTCDFEETLRWPHVEFTEKNVQLVAWDTFASGKRFDFISIDAEGYDFIILQQIDLADTKCLIIEWNSVIDLRKLYVEYCTQYKLKLVHTNSENLIFVK